ncbi:hypothetical protein JCM10212_000694 [Sporobolomyces blumeae]
MQAATSALHPAHRPSSPPPHPTSTAAGVAPPVRLPPVAVPPDDFLPVAFNPERRQSINSDPFLHAFSIPQNDPHASGDPFSHRPPPDNPPNHYGAHGARHPSAGHQGEADGAGRASMNPNGRNGTSAPSAPQEMPRFPPAGAFEQHPNYQFGSSFASTSQVPSQPNGGQGTFTGPTSTYRFGGPSVTASAPLDAPSYFDYSMRRHSLSNNAHGGPSPDRQMHPTNGVGGPLSPTANAKRKSSDEDDEASYHDGSYYPSQAGYAPSNAPGHLPPNAKRRTSSLAFDNKMNGLALSEQQRRESFSPTWEEDRRDSGGSYASSGSQGYGMYQHPQHQQHRGSANSFDHGGSQHPPPPTHDQQHHPAHPPPPPGFQGHFYDTQVGPRGSIARGMYEFDGPNFGRRPSIPGVSQMMQGQAPIYPPHPLPTSQQHPQHQHPPASQAPPQSEQHAQPFAPPPPVSRTSQPSLLVSSVPSHTPTERDEIQSRPPSNGFAVGPPPQWPRNGGPPPPPPHPPRQNSSGSLDPNSALSAKDSPYSRSPELRISHKLAERKRRKEMAQLFEDLREALPVDRGLKSSKWEILSKAIDYIAQLKQYTGELEADNQNLRRHFNLPTGPTSTQQSPNDYPSRQQSLDGHGPTHSSHSQSQPDSPHAQLGPQPSPGLHPFSSNPSQHPPNAAAHIFGPSGAQPPLPSPTGAEGDAQAPPRPHPSRTGSHASSHASSLSMDNGAVSLDQQ